MSFFINLIRNAVGSIIVALDLISRPRKLKRSEEAQKHVESELASLSLYQFYSCPFCIKTRRALHRLNLPMVKRNVSRGSQYRQELAEQGGKIQAPCLRIEKDGKVEWMYESSDIINYLEQRFN
ncbi:glutaredoxin [Alteromonadaceae bacterium M269]|nr:glutaredoxin [Alteromonadaceae bacterium M269]